VEQVTKHHDTWPYFVQKKQAVGGSLRTIQARNGHIHKLIGSWEAVRSFAE
jgi:hypothetical protein